MQLSRRVAIVAFAGLALSCGSTPSGPSGPTRTTESLTVTAHLGTDGGINYGSPANFPSVTVMNAGLVEAAMQFTPTAACQFILCICRTDGNCGTCDLKAGPGPGPTLTTQGTLPAAPYYMLAAGRSLGQSLCSDSVPEGGLPFTYTVTVTHP